MMIAGKIRQRRIFFFTVQDVSAKSIALAPAEISTGSLHTGIPVT